jgi:glutamine synthetase adenylyltransferase
MDLSQALSFSHYATRAFTANPALREEVVAALDAPFSWPNAVADHDEAALGARLRPLRTRVFVHTMLRDLLGRAPLTEVCETMTTLADLA